MAEEQESLKNANSSNVPVSRSDSSTDPRAPQFLCVEYPGVVKNVEKAIYTLGGLNKLAHDYYRTTALELDYHRDNIYSRSATSRVRNGTFLIVKARRRKHRPPVEESVDGQSPPPQEQEEQRQQHASKDDEIEGEVLGLVKSVHRFTSMFDFQYLPVKRVATSSQQPKYEDILPNLFPTDLRLAADWLPEESGAGTSTSASDVDLFLPPYAFSRFATSSFQVLGREPQQVKPTKGAIAAAAGGPVVGLSLRKERRLPCFMVQGHEPFPMEPHPGTIKYAEERCQLNTPNELLKQIFEERPMWSKNAIMEKTRLEESVLKYLMPKYAFYILSGPFGRVWCRFGYDPRKDRNAVTYQTIMINLAKMGLRAMDRFRIGYKVPAANRLKVTSRGLSTGREMKHSKVGKNWYVFEHGVLPPFRQVWYQIGDIQLPVAGEEVRKALAVEDPIFRDGQSENTNAGWLLPGAADRVREAMKESLKATIDELDKGLRGRGASDEEDESQDSDEQDDTEIEYIRVSGVTQAGTVGV